MNANPLCSSTLGGQSSNITSSTTQFASDRKATPRLLHSNKSDRLRERDRDVEMSEEMKEMKEMKEIKERDREREHVSPSREKRSNPGVFSATMTWTPPVGCVSPNTNTVNILETPPMNDSIGLGAIGGQLNLVTGKPLFASTSAGQCNPITPPTALNLLTTCKAITPADEEKKLSIDSSIQLGESANSFPNTPPSSQSPDRQTAIGQVPSNNDAASPSESGMEIVNH